MRLGPRGPQESAKRSGEWLGIVASGEWSAASEAGGSERRCEKSAERSQLENGHYLLAGKELMSTYSDIFMQNEPNSGSLQDALIHGGQGRFAAHCSGSSQPAKRRTD